MDQNAIYVTQPDLPSISELNALIEQIWTSKLLTNIGPLHKRLETELESYLNVPYVRLFSSGTAALLASIAAMDLPFGSKIITSPFTFAATAHAIRLLGYQTIYADIDPNTLNLCPDSVEQIIDNETSAILPVHCYGLPCDLDRFDELSIRYGIPIIYDAAHAFGVTLKSRKSLLQFGQMAAVSFHATKVFHTIEGGCVVFSDPRYATRLEEFRNFGIVDEHNIGALGINGKLSEVHCAVGILNLPEFEDRRQRRAALYQQYKLQLEGQSGLVIHDITKNINANYGYFPIIASTPELREKIYERLKNNHIFSRRYFYPLLSNSQAYQKYSKLWSELPVANGVAERILCLPIYANLSQHNVSQIAEIVREVCNE